MKAFWYNINSSVHKLNVDPDFFFSSYSVFLYLSLWPLSSSLFCLLWVLLSPIYCHFCLQEISFSIPFFQFICAFLPKGIICRQHIIGSCFFIQSATLYLPIGAFSPLTFKVIIDRYVFIAFLNLVFQVIICFFFVPFLKCSIFLFGLMNFFCVCAYVLFYWMFLICVFQVC